MPRVTKQSATKKTRTTRSRTKAKGVLGRIQPISFQDDGLKMNVYGRSGTGKTTFACTFPKPLLLIGAEDGTKSVHNVKGVDFVRLQESGELREVIDFAREDGKYRTVVLDTATSFQDLVLKEILGVDELPAQKSWGMAARDQWAQCALQVKEYLRALLSIEANVIVLAQEREFNTESENDVIMPYVASALTPSVTGWLNPAVDYILQSFIRETTVERKLKVGAKTVTKSQRTGEMEYCVRTGPDPVYTTKFRLPKGAELPPSIADPSYEKVLKLIRGK